MTTPPMPGELLRDGCLPSKKIAAEARKRLDPFEYKNVPPARLEGAIEDGWEEFKRLKRSIKMRRRKPQDRAFEDLVWGTLAKLGFSFMNANREFRIPYGKGESETKQVDVFAADDEVVLVVECKSSSSIRKGETFKTDVEAIQGYRTGMIGRIRQEFPAHKVKFIFATNNYVLSQPTLERLNDAGIRHLGEDGVEYYLELAKHLGIAARYQLLGWLLEGQKIPGMSNTVPAIRGRMGGETYYLFAIEPEVLLKVAYVLHRSKANSDLMPTYQRLIKKSRLKKVTDFVEGGGFFPNSLILNIDSGGKKRGLRFDSVAGGESSSRMGMLHLPKNYRSAYIIDGQHRLYGFADSDRATTELLPVVAFVDMKRSDQVRLFMEINENQKAVPKNLRNTLNADLLWDSEDLRERSRALRLQVAQRMGEHKSSPLFGRVVVGEDTRTAQRCITIDAISNGLNRGRLLGRFSKEAMKESGLLYRGTNQATFDVVVPVLCGVFEHLATELPLQWKLGNDEGGFVFRNSGVEAIIRVLSDILEHLHGSEAVDVEKDDTDEILSACLPYLDALVAFLESRSDEQGQSLRQMYGSGGATNYWRELQQGIRAIRPEFNPVGLDCYLEDQEQAFNEETMKLIAAIESFLKKDIRARLEERYGSSWLKAGVPNKIGREATKRAAEKNYESDGGKEVEAWDCMYLIEYMEVLQYDNTTWKELFQAQYTRPGTEQEKGGWKQGSAWIRELNEVRNKTHHAHTVSQEEYDFVLGLHEWLLED